MKITIILFAFLIMLAGCSDDDSQKKNANVWKEQTDTLNKAKAVEGQLQDAADAERKKIEDQER
jgi:uncharacterized lipoprotein